MSEGDLVRVVATAPRPWAHQLGIVVRHQFFFHRASKVMVYLFKLKQQIPISRDSVILISEAK
jgi:hypothetical protein